MKAQDTLSTRKKAKPLGPSENRPFLSRQNSSFTSLVTLWLAMAISEVIIAQDICGPSQDWFHGWLSDAQVAYSVADVSEKNGMVAVGGSVGQISELFTADTSCVDVSDSDGALVLIFNPGEKDPNWAAVVSSLGFLEIQGVSAISMTEEEDAFILFDVKSGASDWEPLLGVYQTNVSLLRLIQIDAYYAFYFSSPVLRFFKNNQFWLQATADLDWGGTRTSIFSAKFRMYSGNLQLQESAMLESVNDDHVLLDFTLAGDYVVRVTHGMCDIDQGQTYLLMLTVVESRTASHSISLDHGYCLPFSGSASSLDAIQVMAYQSKRAAIVYKQSSSWDIQLVSIEDFTADGAAVLKQLTFSNSGAISGTTLAFEVLSVVRTTAASDQIDMLVKHTTSSATQYFAILGLDPFVEPPVLLQREITVAGGSANSSFGLDSLISSSSRLLYKFQQANFALIGDDWSARFALYEDHSSQCLQTALTTCSFFSTSTSSTPLFYLPSMTDFTEGSTLVNIIDLSYGPADANPNLSDSLFKSNACQLYIQGLFDTTSYNSLTATPTPMNLNTAAIFPACPDGTVPDTNADTSFVQIVNQIEGPNSVMTLDSFKYDFFNNYDSTNILVVEGEGFSTGAYQILYRAGYTGTSSEELRSLPGDYVTVNLGIDCNLVTPTVTTTGLIRDGFTYVRGGDALEISFGGQSSPCSLARTVTLDSTGDLQTAPTFTLGVVKDTYTVSDPDITSNWSENLTFRVEATEDPTQFEEIQFTVQAIVSTCTDVWRQPSTEPFPFAEVEYELFSGLQAFQLTGIDVTDCPFILLVTDITDPTNVISLNEAFTLQQPSLVFDSIDQHLVSVSQYGSLEIDTQDSNFVGDYRLRLEIKANRFDMDNHSRFIEMTVTIKKCVNVYEDSSTLYEELLTYTMGEALLAFPIVSKTKPECLNSELTVFEQGLLPSAFQVTVDNALGEAQVTLEATVGSDLSAGVYSVEVRETDLLIGFVAKTIFQVEVIVPVQQVFEFLLQPEEDLEDQVEEVIEEEPQEDEAESEAEEETEEAEEVEEPVEELAVIFDDGQIIYPWQQVKFQSRSQGDQPSDFVIEEEPEPLRARVQSISATGNLTVAFNKPIIVPPIRVYEPSSPASATNSTERMLSGEFYFEISEVIDIKLESSFYEEGSPETTVTNFTLTRLNEKAFDVQINFQKPNKITQSAAEPDEVQLFFKKATIFMDSLDFTQLKDELQVAASIQPQLSQAEIEELEQICGSVASSMAGLSMGVLVPQIFLAMGLKYLWNIMNLLQFLIFMRMWQINLPETTKIVLGELKSLALLEFIPTDAAKNFLKGLIGMETDEAAVKAPSDSCAAIGESQETGIDRVGSSSLIDNMGAMLFIGLLLLVVLLLLVGLRVCAKKCSCAKKVFSIIKKKLLYNSLLRYVLQSTLKLQIAACTILAYDRMTTTGLVEQQTSQSSRLTSYVIVGALNLCPFLFFFVVRRNQPNLDKQPVRDKIGTLYMGFNAKRPRVETYTLAFLTRRSLFVATTFLLFAQPGIQVQVMIFMTLLYVIFVGHAEFYEFAWARKLEIFNESIFVLVAYNFVLLHNLVWEEQARKEIGNTIIYLTGFLLAANLLVIVVVSLKAIKRKLYLRSLKKKAWASHKAAAAKQNESGPVQKEKAQAQASSSSESSENSSLSSSESDPIGIEKPASQMNQSELHKSMTIKYGLQPVGQPDSSPLFQGLAAERTEHNIPLRKKHAYSAGSLTTDDKEEKDKSENRKDSFATMAAATRKNSVMVVDINDLFQQNDYELRQKNVVYGGDEAANERTHSNVRLLMTPAPEHEPQPQPAAHPQNGPFALLDQSEKQIGLSPMIELENNAKVLAVARSNLLDKTNDLLKELDEFNSREVKLSNLKKDKPFVHDYATDKKLFDQMFGN